MPNDPTTTNGPWRLLILDRDPQDPKWILATVATPGDVEPADLGDVLAILPARAARGCGACWASLTPRSHR